MSAYRNRDGSRRHWLTLAISALALPACADPDAGRALLESRCIRCHAGGAATLETAPEQLPAVLSSGTLRAHRFTLSDRDIAALQAYLTQVKSAQ